MTKQISRTIRFFGSILLFSSAVLLLWTQWGYYHERNQIARDLNTIPGIEVLQIWGHPDLQLEEITAEIAVDDHGILVLRNLSRDAFDYPAHVYLRHINHKSLIGFSCNGRIKAIQLIDLGTKGPLTSEIRRAFHDPPAVIAHFDGIERAIDSLPKWPHLKHLQSATEEAFLAVVDPSMNSDSIYRWLGTHQARAWAKSLDWNDKGCRW